MMRNIFGKLSEISKSFLIILMCIVIIIISIIFIPINLLEYLSLNVVGEPPINGRTWIEGMWELGGEFGMKILAILGFVILGICILFLMQWEPISFKKRQVKNIEIIAFFGITGGFIIINFLIGYSWWDPNAPLGMGSLFFHSILSLIIIGLLPELFKIIFKFDKEDFAISKKNIDKEIFIVVLSAFGYGAVSVLWHCCSLFNFTMYFFFFVIKFIQLWAMTSFFYKWGFKTFMSKTKTIFAYLIISVCFGFAYPWHTFGFAFTFTLFGLILCEITRRTDSYFVSLLLLYFAYIFHAALPWHGPEITLFIIIPISIAICGILFFIHIFKLEKFKISNS
jgi:hypothetical protein